MLDSLYLRDVGPSREMKLELAPRLNVLTGDNGLGKSFALDIAWWALTDNWPGPPAWPARRDGAQPHIKVGHTRGDGTGGQVAVQEVPWRPRGDASSWLTSEVFDLGQARSLDAEKAIARAMDAMRRPDLEIEEARRIHTKLHKVLKDSDPFWVRWRYRAEQAGLET